jgi:cytochrome d ubiquinol oxidase subunit II
MTALTALTDLTAFVLLVTIAAYSVAGGVDYGAGLWDLFAGEGAQANRARALIDHAMAPVWEANNVWLVLALVVCWTGFPLLFQSVFASLYPLFGLALLGLILRGAFFAFRHIEQGPEPQRRTGIVFGISSLLAPFFFAAALGAIASGRVAVGEPNIPVWQACISPMSISFGLVSLAATAFIGATFLVADARRVGMQDMVDYFRRRAVVATVALIVVGTIALVTIAFENPHLLTAMVTGFGAPFVIATVVLTPVVGFLLWRRIYVWFRVLSVGVVGSLVFAWGLAQSPYLLPGQLTIAQAGAPLGTEVLLLVVTLFVILVILPSLGLLVYFDQRGALEPPEP